VDRQRGDDPVFVDRTGRRRRLIAIAGSTGGLVLTLMLLALVAGFTGVGPASVPGWPDAAAAVDGSQPKPSRTAPSARPSPRPAEPAPVGRPRRPASSAAVPAATPTPSASSVTATPSVSVTPTPTNNGRKPSRSPKPHPTKSG